MSRMSADAAAQLRAHVPSSGCRFAAGTLNWILARPTGRRGFNKARRVARWGRSAPTCPCVGARSGDGAVPGSAVRFAALRCSGQDGLASPASAWACRRARSDRFVQPSVCRPTNVEYSSAASSAAWAWPDWS